MLNFLSLRLTTLQKLTIVKPFEIETSANYMIEAWYYNSSTAKLVPTVVKFS